MSDFRPGDARLTVNGEGVTLRLTLGALAEIEDRLGGGDFSELARRLEKPGVGHLLILIEALSAGGGRRLSPRELETADVDLAEAARAVARAFAALHPPSLEKGGREPPDAKRPALGEREGSPTSAIANPPFRARTASEVKAVRESPPFSREGRRPEPLP